MGAKPWLVGAVVMVGVAWLALCGDDPAPPSFVDEAAGGGGVAAEAGRLPVTERRELVADAPPAAPPRASLPAGFPCVELSGCIRTRPGGAPIPGAMVTICNTMVSSDAQGRYGTVFPWSEVTPRVQVTAAGFEPTWAPLRIREPGRAQLDLELTALRRLALQIVDRTTWAPIAGAQVLLRGRGPMSGEQSYGCDATGTIDLDIAVGSVVEITAPEYCPVQWSSALPQSGPPVVRLPLLHVGTVEGTVRDTDGRAVVGATVTQTTQDRLGDGVAASLPGWLVDRPLRSNTRTVGDGSFRIAVRPQSQPQTVVVQSEGYMKQTSRPFVLASPGGRHQLEVVLTKGGSVLGVVRRNGEPWSGGHIQWQSADAEGKERIDGRGFYWLRDLPPGLVTIRLLDALAQVAESRTVTVVAGGELICDFDWQTTVARISGRFTTARGEPVPYVRITAALDGAPERTSSDATDAEGRFAFEFANTGTCTVWAYGHGIRLVQRGVVAGAQDVEFVLPEMRAVRLRLRDADRNEPIVGYGPIGNLLHWRRVGEPLWSPVNADLDVHGVVETVLPCGNLDLRVVAQRHGFARQVVSGVVVGDATGEVPVDLHRGATLRLHVRGETPLVVASVRHQLYLLEDAQVPGVRGPVANWEYVTGGHGSAFEEADLSVLQQTPRFDPDGRATVQGLAPGRYRLVVFPDDLVFEPETFVVGPAGADVELRWRRR